MPDRPLMQGEDRPNLGGCAVDGEPGVRNRGTGPWVSVDATRGNPARLKPSSGPLHGLGDVTGEHPVDGVLGVRDAETATLDDWLQQPRERGMFVTHMLGQF